MKIMCVRWEPRPARQVEDVVDFLESLSPAVEVEEDRHPGQHRETWEHQPAGKQHQTWEHQEAKEFRLEAFLDVAGCCLPPDLGTILEAHTGSTPRLAVGSSKFVAHTAALLARPLLLAEVPPGQEKEFLAPLPIDLLSITPETQAKLRYLGLTTMGQLASLPRSALVMQFGAEGGQAWDLANGIDPRPVTPRRPPAELSHQITFDTPVVCREELAVALETALGKMLPLLARRELACGALSIDLHGHASGYRVHARPPHPTFSFAELAGLLRRQLPTTLSSPVTGVTLTLHELRSGREQLSLFQGPLCDARRQRQNEAVASVQRRWGEHAILRVVSREPRSLLPERHLAFAPWPATLHHPWPANHPWSANPRQGMSPA